MLHSHSSTAALGKGWMLNRINILQDQPGCFDVLPGNGRRSNTTLPGLAQDSAADTWIVMFQFILVLLCIQGLRPNIFLYCLQGIRCAPHQQFLRLYEAFSSFFFLLTSADFT